MSAIRAREKAIRNWLRQLDCAIQLEGQRFADLCKPLRYEYVDPVSAASAMVEAWSKDPRAARAALMINPKIYGALLPSFSDAPSLARYLDDPLLNPGTVAAHRRDQQEAEQALAEIQNSDPLTYKRVLEQEASKPSIFDTIRKAKDEEDRLASRTTADFETRRHAQCQFDDFVDRLAQHGLVEQPQTAEPAHLVSNRFGGEPEPETSAPALTAAGAESEPARLDIREMHLRNGEISEDPTPAPVAKRRKTKRRERGR